MRGAPRAAGRGHEDFWVEVGWLGQSFCRAEHRAEKPGQFWVWVRCIKIILSAVPLGGLPGLLGAATGDFVVEVRGAPLLGLLSAEKTFV